MAKKFVKFTLAAKCRVLFGAAVILIIGAALAVPWMYMRAMLDEAPARAGAEITRMYLAEWAEQHVGVAASQPSAPPAARIPRLFTANDPTGQRTGPVFLALKGDGTLAGPSSPADARAAKAFLRSAESRDSQIVEQDDRGRSLYRDYHAVRAEAACLACHKENADPHLQFKPNALVGLIRADLPAGESAGSLTVSRLVIIGAGVLAFLLASLTFYFITQRLILSPVRQLRRVADKVAEGDLTVRSGITTGDEFEQLGRSFDGMLGAITETQSQLRAANRALDLKLNELGEANVALFESNRLKSEFLANVSHELRTPLTSIIGFAELVSQHPDEKLQRFGGNILTSARMLLAIINDLLDLARIEAGKTRLSVTQASVADVCETLFSLVGPLGAKKNLKLTLDVQPDLPVLNTDAGKVQQILYNLLSNAIKFTPAGGAVTLSARKAEPPLAVSVSVADTGPGISEADQAVIFEKFQQLDASVTREHGGAGLGLAIAKELTDLLGGKLSLQSQPGQGATFTLQLPAEIPSPSRERAG